MTACVNKNHARRVAGVVTASLVGAHTLGGVSLAAVPTVALAEQGSLQSVDIFTDAKVTQAKDNKGNLVDVADLTFEPGKYLVPVEVENNQGVKTNVTGAAFGYYSDKALTNRVSEDDMKTPGTYYVKIRLEKDGTEYVTSTGIAFKVVAKSLDGLTAYEKHFDAAGEPTDDTSDTTFTYNGDAQNIGFAIDGENQPTTSVTYYKANSDSTQGSPTAPTLPGDYTAKVSVTSGGTTQTKSVNFTIGKLDLSSASVTMDDTNGAAMSNGVKVEGVTNATVLGNLATSITSSPDGNSYWSGEYGKYTVKVTPKKVDGKVVDSNITGEATVSFYKYANAVSSGSFKYDDDTVTAGSTLTFDASKGQKFDAASIAVWADADGDETYATDVTYSDVNTGKAVEASALANPGTYKVTVRVVPSEDNGWAGGSLSFYAKVQSGKINADKTVAFYKDGDLVSGTVTTLYDGSDVLKSLTVSVTDKKGNKLEQGKDFSLVVKKGTKTVDSITDAGVYNVTVDAPGYQVSGSASLIVDVKAVDIKNEGSSANGIKDQAGLVWTGSDLAVPGVKYLVRSANGTAEKDEDGNYVYADLASDLYNVVSIKNSKGKVVTSLKDADTYTVTVALTDKAGQNYLLNDSQFTVKVSKASSFADVADDAWYAKGVMNAWKQYYVNGISGTQLFAPEADITRADATVILFNMAGGSSLHGDDEFQFTEDKGYNTGFSDVDGHAYYAKAIAWAKAAGVATGDAGTTSFRPTDKISRQEFAALLVKYAKSTGKYVAPAEDALSKVSDADTVDVWATEAVNWAVANKVMGNGGYVAGRSEIKRAEVATMGVNFQPKSPIDRTVPANDPENRNNTH